MVALDQVVRVPPALLFVQVNRERVQDLASAQDRCQVAGHFHLAMVRQVDPVVAAMPAHRAGLVAIAVARLAQVDPVVPVDQVDPAELVVAAAVPDRPAVHLVAVAKVARAIANRNHGRPAEKRSITYALQRSAGR